MQPVPQGRPDAATSGAAPPPPPPPTRPGLGSIVLGVGLVAAGVLWLLAALGVDVPVGSVAPIALVVLGVAVVVGAVRGEDGAAIGLAVFVGVWLAIAAVVTAAVDVPLVGAVGDHSAAPATAADLEDSYRLFAGTQTLDLRGLELAPGTTEVSLSTVLGQVEVVVPARMAVRVDAGVTAGAVVLFDRQVEGVGLEERDSTSGWVDAPRRLDLELRVGLGEIHVRDG